MENEISEKIQKVFMACSGIQIDMGIIRRLQAHVSNASEADLDNIINLLENAKAFSSSLKKYLKSKDAYKDKLEETDPAIIILRPEDIVNVRNSGTDHWPLHS